MLYKYYHNREQHKVRQVANFMSFINSYKMDNKELIIFGISRQTLQYLLDGNKTD